MHHSQNKSGTGDMTASTRTRRRLDNSFTLMSQDSIDSGIESIASQLQASKYHHYNTFTTMPCKYHDFCDQSHLNGAFARNHGPQCQQQRVGCACCPSFPYLNSPFDPSVANRDHMTTVSVPSNRTPSFLLYQTEPDACTIRPSSQSMQMDVSNAFARPHQSTMIFFEPNAASFERRDMTSQVSSTPKSHVTTPDSIFSLPHQRNGSRYASGGYGTPASTVSANENGQLKKEEMSPLQGYRRAAEEANELQQAQDEVKWLTEDNDDHDWLPRAEVNDLLYGIQETVSLAEQSIGHDAVVPYHSHDDLSWDVVGNPPGQGPIDYELSNTGTRPGHMLAEQYFNLPPSRDTLNEQTLDAGNAFLNYDGLSAYSAPQQAVNTGAYIGLNFSEPMYSTNYYDLYGGMQSTLPSNVKLTTDGSVVNSLHQQGHTRGRQMGHDPEMDRKLIAWRNVGMSYKEIMEKGNFGLEESTLRGRYRTLTKSKDQRLRKPVWDDRAIVALQEGVNLLAPNRSKRPLGKLDKVPWKKVAEWMQRERGCYLYGNATVKKKYMELERSRQYDRRRTMV